LHKILFVIKNGSIIGEKGTTWVNDDIFGSRGYESFKKGNNEDLTINISDKT
jgi:hypothetical protein